MIRSGRRSCQDGSYCRVNTISYFPNIQLFFNILFSSFLIFFYSCFLWIRAYSGEPLDNRNVCWIVNVCPTSYTPPFKSSHSFSFGWGSRMNSPQGEHYMMGNTDHQVNIVPYLKNISFSSFSSFSLFSRADFLYYICVGTSYSWNEV